MQKEKTWSVQSHVNEFLTRLKSITEKSSIGIEKSLD